LIAGAPHRPSEHSLLSNVGTARRASCPVRLFLCARRESCAESIGGSPGRADVNPIPGAMAVADHIAFGFFVVPSLNAMPTAILLARWPARAAGKTDDQFGDVNRGTRSSGFEQTAKNRREIPRARCRKIDLLTEKTMWASWRPCRCRSHFGRDFRPRWKAHDGTPVRSGRPRSALFAPCRIGRSCPFNRCVRHLSQRQFSRAHPHR